MSDESTIEKIKKLEGKKKSAGIIKLLDGKHSDAEVMCAALEALSNIGDEDSVNHITHFLDHPDSKVRIAACKAGVKIGTEYMKTRVRYQLSVKQDPQTKAAIQEAFNEKYA